MIQILEGSKFSFWLKEKTDDTLFEELKAIMDGSDNTLKEGKFGTDFWGPVDNVIIAEKAADILTEEPMGKLTFSWARLNGIQSSEFGLKIGIACPENREGFNLSHPSFNFR